MATHDTTACVILAGGRGSRMASADLHKVCFPIAGRPAIVRAIDTYKAAGLRRLVVVVGQQADQVMATVAEAHPEVQFVYQARPGGTDESPGTRLSPAFQVDYSAPSSPSPSAAAADSSPSFAGSNGRPHSGHRAGSFMPSRPPQGQGGAWSSIILLNSLLTSYSTRIPINGSDLAKIIS